MSCLVKIFHKREHSKMFQASYCDNTGTDSGASSVAADILTDR